MTPLLNIKDLSRTYENRKVLSNIDLSLESNSVLSILGKSGSGKTTLLKIIAGLQQADSGTISLEGESVNLMKPQDRNIVYLYQEALLFPHLNVFENIAFGLRLKKYSKQEIETKVIELLQALGLRELLNKSPEQLSGGEKQRVAFGRAMAVQPKILLLDEPFGALDVETRRHMQKLFKELAERFSISALFVTHDLKEAIIMGDRIGKIENGNYTAYSSKKEFYKDAKSGVQNEINFWKTIE
jgi:putrescine transport system ATP-binding protein